MLLALLAATFVGCGPTEPDHKKTISSMPSTATIDSAADISVPIANPDTEKVLKLLRISDENGDYLATLSEQTVLKDSFQVLAGVIREPISKYELTFDIQDWNSLLNGSVLSGVLDRYPPKKTIFDNHGYLSQAGQVIARGGKVLVGPREHQRFLTLLQLGCQVTGLVGTEPTGEYNADTVSCAARLDNAFQFTRDERYAVGNGFGENEIAGLQVMLRHSRSQIVGELRAFAQAAPSSGEYFTYFSKTRQRLLADAMIYLRAVPPTASMEEVQSSISSGKYGASHIGPKTINAIADDVEQM